MYYLQYKKDINKFIGGSSCIEVICIEYKPYDTHNTIWIELLPQHYNEYVYSNGYSYILKSNWVKIEKYYNDLIQLHLIK